MNQKIQESQLPSSEPKHVLMIDVDVKRNWDWEELVSFGMQLREMDDEVRFAYGDLAMIAKEQYGAEGVFKLAQEVGKKPDTLDRYRQVAQKIPRELRGEYKHLSWSHFRHASGRKSVTETVNILEVASDNQWTAQKMGVEIHRIEKGEVKVKPTFIVCDTCSNYIVRGGDVCTCPKEH